MSRLVLLLTVLAVSVLPTRSQNSDTPAAHSGHDHTQMHAEPSQMMCKQMMAEHVAEMKATSQTLATNLAQMKATLPLINDVNERSRWQSNIAMWQSVADHFSHMAEHAAHMQAMGMGCGMMMGHGAEDKPAAPAKTQ